MPVVIGKLDAHNDSAHPGSAILFEPQGPVAFERAWAEQRAWQRRLLEGSDAREALWLLEHQPCYTLGRGASSDHLHFPINEPPAPVHRIDRGGEVTHHLPGQLVAYPVLDLQRRCPDLHWYLRQLEQVLIDVMEQLDLQGERQPGLTGIWVDNRKVAAIGVGCRRWITQHGLALNIDCDMTGFGQITACGLQGRAVGRLADWRPGLTVEQVQPLMRDAFATRFGLAWSTEA